MTKAPSSAEPYGPDNPRPWDPNHRMLKSPYAPHETAAVLRIQRTGLRGAALMKATRTPGHALAKALEAAMTAENKAKEMGREIYDALMPKGAV